MNLGKMQQGLVVYLSFTDKVRKNCNDLSRMDVSKVDGLDAFIRKIIDLCMQKIQSAFMAHKNVENFKRPDYINIVKQINEFE